MSVSRSNLRMALMATVVAIGLARPAAAQLIVGRGVDGNDVYHYDINTQASTPLFNLAASGITFGNGVEGLDVDDAGRTIYFITGGTSPTTEVVYRAHYDDRDFSDPTRIRVRKVTEVRYGATPPRLSGLAFNSVNGKLYSSMENGGTPEGIYEINQTTGELTLVMDFSTISGSVALSGLAFYPATGLYYTTNNTSLVLESINLADPPASARTALPGATIASIDEGLAIGGDKAYILPSNAGVDIKVYNLLTNSFDANIPNAIPWTGNDGAAGAGWGPNALVVPAGSNLATTISSTPTNVLEYAVGTQITYTVRYTNFGPADATNLAYSIVLSGTATATINGGSISSTSGTAAEGPTGTITGSLPAFNVGSFEDVSFTVTTTGAGTLTVTTSLPPGANTDGYLGNNTEALSHVLRTYNNQLVFTSEASSPKSNVPGMPGIQIEATTTNGNERIRKPVSSPAGTYVAFRADTNAAAASDIMYLRKDGSNNWSVVLQEGVTPVSTGNLAGEPRTSMILSLLDDGRFGWVGDTNAASGSDEMGVFFDNTNHTVVARESNIIPALSGAGIGYGSTMDSMNVTGDGRFGLRISSMTGAASGQNTGIVSDSGQTVLSRSGITIPANQLSGGTLAISTLTSDRFFMDCAGYHYLYAGSLAGSVPVIVVDGSAVFQAGSPVSGFTGTLASSWSTVAGIIYSQMYSNGDWYCRGSTAVSSEDFVLKGQGTSYSTVAKNGDPIYTGSTEHWSDVDGFSPTFFGFAANRQGDYVLAGRTDNSNLSKNAVAVANGTTELFREGDRVDLNDNGLYDDDAFISTFVVDMQLLTDDGHYYAVCDLRNGAGTFIAKGLIRADNVGTLPQSGADIVVTKTVSDNFLEAQGQQTVFTINVCNYGPSAATNVVLNDPLPVGLDFVSATNGAGESAPNSNIVTATIPTLPSCGCQSYQITVQAAAQGVWDNTATATSSTTDPVPANNSASAAVTVQYQTDLSVTKTDSGGAPVGQNFTYTITITNNGPATATNVMMTDNLDTRTSFVSGTNGAHETSPGSKVVVTTIPSIVSGGSAVVQITVVGNQNGLMVNNVSVTGAETDPVPGNNSATRETLVGDASDISVSMQTAVAHVTGTYIPLVITVTNNGPAVAPNVVLTGALSPGLAFVSATGGIVESPPASGNFSVTIPSIGIAGSAVFTVTATATVDGTYFAQALVDPFTTVNADPDDLNNTANATLRVAPFRQIRAIHTQIVGHPTAVVNGLLDGSDQPVVAYFDSMANCNVSPDGSRWTIDASSNLAATSIDSAMVIGSGFTSTVLAQEGKQAPGAPGGTLITFFDDDVGFNSSNDFAWGVLTSGTSKYLYTNIGGVNSIVAQRLDPILGMVDVGVSGDETLENSFVSEHLLDDGRVGFDATNNNNINANNESALIYWQTGVGLTAFKQEGVTVVGADTITSFSLGRVFETTPDGLHFQYRANIAAGNVMVVDDVPVLRSTDLIPSTAITVTAIFDSQMATNGAWIARGDDPADNDWVVRNGTLVAATGQSVVGGAETWGVSISNARVNASGDYLITGNTSEPDTNFNEVMVLNGTTIIVREGDPVDLNGNGLFDDNAYVGAATPAGLTFSSNQTWLANDGRVHFLAPIRTAEGVSLNTAFLVVNAKQGCLTITGDANGTGIRNGRDVQAIVNCVLGGGPTAHPCKCADTDNDGDIDAVDIASLANTLVTDP